ncbi:MAG: hypothetical protein ACE5EF_14655, partial [Dehalococcoidia bacterium]
MADQATEHRRDGAGRAARIRGSAAGWLIPVAVLGGVSAFETARTSSAGREVFVNITYPAVMYFVFALSVAIIGAAFYQRYRIWHLGRPADVSGDLGARITNALTLGAGTSRLTNDRYSGVMHWCIYSSF